MSIYRNKTDSLVVEFGTGDIGVSIVNYNGLAKGVGFHEMDEPIPIGDNKETPERKSDSGDILFFFTRLQSIDVVIGKLNELKVKMIEQMPETTDLIGEQL